MWNDIQEILYALFQTAMFAATIAAIYLFVVFVL